MNPKVRTDVLIVGCGITGLSIALELKRRFPDLKILLIEKEKKVACHASGRNSGVIHAGFYYTPNSLKACFTVEGNRLMTEYCIQNGLKIRRNGKVVVTKSEAELESLYELKRRGDKNGVTLELINEKELKKLEPNARTYEKALHSPTTSSVNPGEVVEHIAKEVISKKNVSILFNECFVKRRDENAVATNNHEKIEYRYLINTAGLYADKIAHQYGAGLKYTLLPFKGLYLEYKDHNFINKSIYPVPDMKYPFLGVHFTKTVEGKVKIGPTAIPAFWRENYGGLTGFDLKELLETLSIQTGLFVTNSNNFRKIAVEELKKTSKNYLGNEAAHLVHSFDKSKVGNYLNPGIRAQLYDKSKKMLEMDFVIEKADDSIHILNAVSPAFTCSFSFSKFIVDEIAGSLN